MGFRILGLLAILGGVGVTIGAGIHVVLTLASPDVRPWDVVKDPLEASIMAVAGIGGIVALAVVIAGLAFLFQDRISNGTALAASIGSVGGVLGVLGAFPALFLMPIGSAILAWDLARARVLSRWEAAAHVASAIGFLVSIAAMMNNTQLGVAVVLTLFYPLTWLAIGGSVLRSVPMGPEVPGGSLPTARLP